MSYENKGTIAPKYIVSSFGDGNYNCNGTSDEDEINQAINDLTSGRDHRETVFLKGDFIIDDPIIIESYTNLVIHGTVYLANGSNCNMVEFANAGSTHDIDWGIFGGHFNGNKANQSSGHGIYYTLTTNTANNVPPMQIFNVNIEKTYADGIHFECPAGKRATVIRIHNVWVRNAGDDAIYFLRCSDTMLSDLLWIQGSGTNLHIKDGGGWKIHNVYCAGGPNGAIFEGLQETQINTLFSDNAGGVGIQVRGMRHSQLHNINVRGVGGLPANLTAVEIEDGSGYHTEDTIFCGFNIWSDAANNWDYGLEEVDANQDYNIFSNINGRDCDVSALKKRGANSTHCASSILGGVT